MIHRKSHHRVTSKEFLLYKIITIVLFHLIFCYVSAMRDASDGKVTIPSERSLARYEPWGAAGSATCSELGPQVHTIVREANHE